MFTATEAAAQIIGMVEPKVGPQRKAQLAEVLDSRVEQKLRRVARALLPVITGAQPRVAIFGSVGPREKTFLWLTQGVAAMLHKSGVPISVLAVNSSELERQEITRAPYLEFVSADLGTADSLGEKLQQLLAAKRAVFVHVNHALTSSELPFALQNDAVFVLVAHATQTRKAAVDVLKRQLEQHNVPIIAAVLLDREYPIPQLIYRLL